MLQENFMVTAKDVQKILTEHDPLVDSWITDILVPKMTEIGDSVLLGTEVVSDYWKNHNKPYNVNQFIEQMKKRGFFAEIYCEDRPCAIPLIAIRIP